MLMWLGRMRGLEAKYLSIRSEKAIKYQPSGAGGTRSLPVTPHRPLNPTWPTGSGKGSNPRLLGALINFCKLSFLIGALLL